MKTTQLFSVTIFALFCMIFESSGQATQSTNAITTGSYLGTSNNLDVIFRKNNVFSGMLNTTNSSFGYDSFSFSSGASPYYNSAFGALALKNLTAGNGGYNTAIGYSSLTVNTGNFNTAVGCLSLVSNSSGVSNTALGYRSLYSNLTGTKNIGIGTDALFYLQSGSFNIAIGDGALAGLTSTPPSSYTNGSNNIAIGREALRFNLNPVSNIAIGDNSFWNSTGNNNIGLGMGSGQSNTTGSYNIAIGTRATATSGLDNILIGYQANPPAGYFNHSLNIGNVIWGLNMRNVDSNDNTFQTIAKRGAIGIGNPNPGNTLDVLSNGLGLSGLRLSNLPNSNFSTSTPTSNRRVLTVNTNGDVILVDDVVGTGTGGGITQNCSTANFVPVNSSTVGQLNCSQIFDNGTSVGIGLVSPTTNNWNYASLSTVGLTPTPTTGVVKFDVNGVIRSTAYLATSDKKFKKDIKSIESPLEKIQKLDGKTYFWIKDANKEIEFDNGLHSGFIAQELEKVLPHLVATDEKGNKAVNYMELMPYLVEAIKEQQAQINDLKAQIGENFKAQNQDLMNLENTKIISISPNPSNDMITVSFNVEKSVQSAKLLVHDLNGNVISSLNISDRENNLSRTLQKDNFGKGIYIVSLVINGKSIDTKKIVFN